MRSRNLIILAVSVIALGAFIYFVERHQPTSDDRRARADRIFPGLDADDIASIDLERDGMTIRLERSDDDWRVIEPIDYPADGGAVRMLAQAIADLDADRVLAADEVDAAEYGLDDPRLTIALIDDEGRTYGLRVGNETPLGSNRAVQRSDAGEIMLCSSNFVASLDREVDDWRSRDIVELLETDLGSIEITAGEDHIRAERVDGRWWLSEPVADLADPEHMRSLVAELNGLRVSEFLEPDGELPVPAGGDYRIVLAPTDGAEPTELELVVDDPDSATLLCRRNKNDLFRVPDGIRARLDKAPVLWRSSKAWPLSSWDVSKLEIAAAGDQLVLDRVDGMWRLDGGGEVDQADARRRLNALVDLEALEHDLVLPPTEVMGSVILIVDTDTDTDTDTGAEGLTYTFYNPIEEGGHAALTVSSRRNVMGIDAALAETILGDLGALRAAENDNPADE